MSRLGRPKLDLARERLAMGHSIRSFARAAGVSQPTVKKAENGESISPPSARKIAEAFGKSIPEVWEIEVPEAA